ncbi:hypothetical protein H257_03031 [Aphanomyces astaci]|uniref:dolichyl-P-Man:Man5GlcNAc2-PP-dolichol alpha-1,3-mannosyltransferase n=2 Tax=Aphanomyces astaci TaxID=112090 RepID=W4H1T6_APHAT|nr:hypothetical protein H257_03031 [Aphanomyces astaci]ETV85214.1 hypothetical protein H257_03031 [Aphanomyces astaci]|eukprot:XP_009825232.1 hypothetical protein H257_03031 [Aphanomyces astaci]
MAGGKAKGTSLRSEKRTTRIDKDVKKVSATNKLLSYAYDLLWSYRYFHVIVAILLAVEVVLGVLIIQKIPYTEIDWKAYMQQVTQFKNGERDYLNIRGDTGPLVYPAGHVYIYSILHWVTNNGQDIRLAQYIFLGFYLITISAIFAIFYRSRVAPPWTAILVCTSKRLHSIYMLRLFNDGIAMMFLFIAVYLCCRQQWRLGCLVYSFAVSIKMNVLLFAPALFFLLLQSSGVLRTIGYLSICASLQVALALPFLKTFWWSYLTKAFEFSRVFTYTWTVNWKCIPEHIFLSKPWALFLLSGHIVVLIAFLHKYFFSGPQGLSVSALVYKPFTLRERVPIRVERIVTSLCVVNFVGICFARTLHYQFYAWYFPTLPYLLWKTNMPLIFKAKVLIICEFAFNTFPATDVSSTVLHLSHFMLLASLFTASDESKYQSYLDAETRQDLTHFVNEECFDAARQFAMYYGSVTEELAEGAKVVSIDEQEIVLRLPKMNFTLAIGFGSSAPVTTEGYARRVLSGMSKEAEDGLARGVNMGQVMTRDYNEFKKNNNEAADDGELNVQLRRRK